MTHTVSPNSSSYSPSEAEGASHSYTDEISTTYERLMEILTEELNLRSKLRELFENQSQKAQDALEVAKRHYQAVKGAQEEMLRSIEQKKREIDGEGNLPLAKPLNDITEERHQNMVSQLETNNDSKLQEPMSFEEPKEEVEHVPNKELMQLENEKEIAQERLGYIEQRIRQVEKGYTSYKGVIEVWDTMTERFLGYINKETSNGTSKYSNQLSNAAYFSFAAQKGASVSQVEISAQDGIDGFPFLGLIQGYANTDSYIRSNHWNYLFVGGTSHSAPGATPQKGDSSYVISARTWESSVWTINTITGDITPQWVNPDGSTPKTLLLEWDGHKVFGSGDPAQIKAYGQKFGSNVKLKFNTNPI